MVSRLPGKWWIAATPDIHAEGWLVIDAAGTISLELLGSLDSPLAPFAAVGTTSAIAGSGVDPLIHGVGAGKAFTLLDCFQTSAQVQFPAGTSTETIRVARAIGGAHLDQADLAAFTSAWFQLEGLVEWMAQPGPEYTPSITDDGRRVHTLTLTESAEERVAGAGGATVVLRHSPRLEATAGARVLLAQDYTAAVEVPHPARIDELLAYASDLQDLVSIGIGLPAAYRQVHLLHPSVVADLDTRTVQVPLELHAEWTVRRPTDATRPTPLDIYFTYEDLGGAGGVTRWMRTADTHRHTLDRVMATRYAEDMFVSDRMLNYAASLDAYDTVDHPDPANGPRISLKQRLDNCITKAGPTFAALIGDTDAWADAVTKARHDIAHHKTGMHDGATHYYLAESAYWLYVLCLLTDAGAPQEVFDRISAHRQFKWIRQQLPTVLSASPAAQ